MMEPGEPHREVRRTGHNRVDLAIALSALLISLTSLVVAVVHSRTLERMANANSRLVEANSWPFLAYTTSNQTDAGAVIVLEITNKGVGPAKIESVDVKWKGKTYFDAIAFLKACCGYNYAPWTTGLQTSIPTGVLRAGEAVTLLMLPNKPANAQAWDNLNLARKSGSLNVIVCYCSVFDECWKSDIARYSLTPHPVERCESSRPSFGTMGP